LYLHSYRLIGAARLNAGRWAAAHHTLYRQNQQLRPPWWSLYERVFQKAKGALLPWQRLHETWWRLTTGRVHYLIGVTALAWLLVLAMSWLTNDDSTDVGKLDAMATLTDSLGKILAFALTIWTIIQATSRSLLFGSAKAARNYTELTSDPMSDVTRHFSNLIQRVNTRKKRVAIFIDDLDRCQSSYVIELLEGIQTVFRGAPVLFVIAADRHWLNACYEDAYHKLKTLVHEPGKPLGTLFLEKAFQFNTSVPGIPAPIRDAYWQHLIRVKEANGDGGMEEAQQKAKAMMADSSSEAAVIEAVKRSQGLSFGEQRAIREQAVIRLAATEIIEIAENNNGCIVK